MKKEEEAVERGFYNEEEEKWKLSRFISFEEKGENLATRLMLFAVNSTSIAVFLLLRRLIATTNFATIYL